MPQGARDKKLMAKFMEAKENLFFLCEKGKLAWDGIFEDINLKLSLDVAKSRER
jgi:hypothetical protein